MSGDNSHIDMIYLSSLSNSLIPPIIPHETEFNKSDRDGLSQNENFNSSKISSNSTSSVLDQVAIKEVSTNISEEKSNVQKTHNANSSLFPKMNIKPSEKSKPEKKGKQKTETVQEVLPYPSYWNSAELIAWEKWLNRDPTGKIKTRTARAAQRQINIFNEMRNEGKDIVDLIDYAVDRDKPWQGVERSYFDSYLKSKQSADNRYYQKSNRGKWDHIPSSSVLNSGRRMMTADELEEEENNN
jgi:hypothetical protein